jgi:DNA-binding HxlR family transcriptional regulator
MTTPRENSINGCPLTAAWAAVGGKWKLTIIYWLAAEQRHFAGLRRQLDAVSAGISQKVLAQQLRELIADGIVARERTGAVPSPVVYGLTDYGMTVLPMLEMVRVWGVHHLQRGCPDHETGRHNPRSCVSKAVRLAS